MNKKIKAILDEIEEELIENAGFHELDTANDEMIIFNYLHYWDGYPEFSESIKFETTTLLGYYYALKNAGFTGFYFVNDYVKGKD